MNKRWLALVVSVLCSDWEWLQEEENRWPIGGRDPSSSSVQQCGRHRGWVVGVLLVLLSMQGLTRLNAQTSSVIEGTIADPPGSYHLPGLPAGTHNLRVLGTALQKVTVVATLPLIEADAASSGTTILLQQIEQMPLNGWHYHLNLIQPFLGVVVNPRVDACRVICSTRTVTSPSLWILMDTSSHEEYRSFMVVHSQGAARSTLMKEGALQRF